MAQPRDQHIAEAILTLCVNRGLDKTICPSEAARVIAGNDNEWRELLDDIRRVGAALVQQGQIEFTQRGTVVDPADAKGPIRFRMRSGDR